MNVLRAWWIRAHQHRHNWRDSCWNSYGVCAERQCEGCGAFQHRTLNPIGEHGDWIDGEHELAAKQRGRRSGMLVAKSVS